MSTAVHHHITLEQFLARPDREDDQREELIEGELILSPSAKVPHAAIVRRLRLGLAPLEQRQSYAIVNDISCILGDGSMPAPDLAVIQLERWDRAEAAGGWLDGSPELVIEVSSPSNRKLQRKAALYLEHGAEQVWIVYPRTKTVTVMTPEGTTEAGMGETLEFHGVGVTVESIMARAGN
ncbi:MAG: Uma2 family endonuclease [Acidobacteriota bacterium]|nr:Uma2 family endonuclease [Acidobacteriota bacterium]